MRAVVGAMVTAGAWPLLGVSAVAWGVMFAASVLPHDTSGVAWTICASPGTQIEWDTIPLDAFLMLCAMTPPLLWLPLRYLRARTLYRRRCYATLLFVIGYGAVWLGALALLWTLSGVLHRQSGTVSALMAAGIALLWQGSAMKARALLRCHALPPLPAFGVAADLASLRFGASLGLWCASSCWALMLAAMALPVLQVPAMAIAAATATMERYRRAPRPRSQGHLLLGGAALLSLAALLP